VGFEGVSGGFSSLVFGLSRWFKKGSFAASRVSGPKMKWPLTSALLLIAHAIQSLLTTPMLHPFCFQTRHFGADRISPIKRWAKIYGLRK
jgi:hypothetical protein